MSGVWSGRVVLVVVVVRVFDRRWSRSEDVERDIANATNRGMVIENEVDDG